MTQNERRLVGILGLASLLAAISLSVASSLLRIRSAEAAEATTRAAIAKAIGDESERARLQRRIDELERRLARAAAGAGLELADFGLSMKAHLARWALAPSRYQLSASGDEGIEFAVSGTTLAFLSFLHEAETRGARLASPRLAWAGKAGC